MDVLRKLLEKDPEKRPSWGEIENYPFWGLNFNNTTLSAKRRINSNPNNKYFSLNNEDINNNNININENNIQQKSRHESSSSSTNLHTNLNNKNDNNN